uniref:Uncharacterized protein n=1 Tax=Mycena chlorophos TaxID=658473 RepID=A0ABQ0L5L1_MYCCL|nr:predicted protein [Mycena chlorophos]
MAKNARRMKGARCLKDEGVPNPRRVEVEHVTNLLATNPHLKVSGTRQHRCTAVRDTSNQLALRGHKHGTAFCPTPCRAANPRDGTRQ